MAYLRRLANDYSDIVTVESIGQSYEGRDILLLKYGRMLHKYTGCTSVLFCVID